MYTTYEMLKAKTFKPNVRAKYAHLKRDGHRVVYIKDDVGLVSAVSSLNIDMTAQLRQFPFHLELLKHMPPNTVVEGELWVPGKPASYIKTAIKEGDQAARFSCFAIPFWNNTQIFDYTLHQLSHLALILGINFIKYMEVPDGPINPLVWYDYAEREGDCEGWVFKNYNYAEWWKLKRVKTIDCMVTDTVDGNGKNLGLVGSLVCSVRCANGVWVPIANAGGMNDLDRAEMSLDDPCGRICEIEYQYIGSKGRCRHPRFKRWRDDDKLLEGCTTAQDTDLEEYYDHT
jgi:ATP-dependent DNA ligase